MVAERVVLRVSLWVVMRDRTWDGKKAAQMDTPMAGKRAKCSEYLMVEPREICWDRRLAARKASLQAERTERHSVEPKEQ